MDRPPLILSVTLVALLMEAATVSAQPMAQDPPLTFTISPGHRFTEQSGEALYNASCAGSHMQDGKGAHRARVTTRRSLTTRPSKQQTTSSSTYSTAQKRFHPLATR